MNGKPLEVYWVAEGEPDSEGVVRYSGDPDEFTALAWWWLATHNKVRDAAVGIRPAVPGWFWWAEGGEYGQTLYQLMGEDTAPDMWRGAEIRSVQIGCSDCGQLHGRHDEGCLNDGLAGLATLQFHGDRTTYGPFGTCEVIHAVRRRSPSHRFNMADTPGPTLCGLDRFSPTGPRWTVGGGIYDPAERLRGCYLCGKVARREFPGLPITGTRQFAVAFATSCRVPLEPHLDPAGLWRAELAGDVPEGVQLVVDGSCL